MFHWPLKGKYPAFSCLKKAKRKDVDHLSLSLCVCVRAYVRVRACPSVRPFQISKQLADFHETWHEHYTIREHSHRLAVLFPAISNKMANARNR